MPEEPVSLILEELTVTYGMLNLYRYTSSSKIKHSDLDSIVQNLYSTVSFLTGSVQ